MTPNINRQPTTGKRGLTVEQLAWECLVAADGNPDRAIALAQLRLREIYIAQIKKAESDYFARVKRAATRTSAARTNREAANG